MRMDFSATGPARVAVGTIGGALFCVIVTLLVDSFNFAYLTPDALERALLIDILLPIALGVPLLWFLLHKMRQLAIAHRDISVIASTDSLTSVLNRGAFTLLVDAYLARANEAAQPKSGALLVIDADHFKLINDRLGHQQGDQALKLIASVIKGVLRPADIVGRIGGEEFGVFMPGANDDQVAAIAENIRRQINQTEFPAAAKTNDLSVSVGGVIFDHEAAYDELFIQADKCLYAAKSGGRNQIKLHRLAA